MKNARKWPILPGNLFRTRGVSLLESGRWPFVGAGYLPWQPAAPSPYWLPVPPSHFMPVPAVGFDSV
jgi:hypothetical protein